MPWVGPRYVLGMIDPPYFNGEIGAPNNGLVPQWPTPNSNRIGAKWRWITEAERRPMAQRILARIDYSSSDPATQGGLYDFTEFAWLDMFQFQDFVLFSDPGASPYGTRISGGLCLEADNVSVQPASVLEAWGVRTAGDPQVIMSQSHGSALLWKKPSTEILHAPSHSPCALCVTPTPERLSLTISGVVASGGLESLRDSFANGTYELNQLVGSPCAFRLNPDPSQPPVAPFMLYSASFTLLDSVPTLDVRLVMVESGTLTGPDVAQATRQVALPVALEDGQYDCAGGLPANVPNDPLVNFPLPNWDWGPATVSVDVAGAAPPQAFPYKRLTTYGFSECYPESTFSDPDLPVLKGEAMRHALTIVATTGQSLTGSPYVSFGDVQFDVGGWVHPSDDSKLVVPAGVKFVRAGTGVGTSSNTNDASINFHKNGASFPGSPWHREETGGGSSPFRCSIYAPRIAVIEGDEFQVQVSKTSATVTNTNPSYLYLEEIEPRRRDINQTVVDRDGPLPAIGVLLPLFSVDSAIDGHFLRKVAIFLGGSNSPSSIITLGLDVVRGASRVQESVLSTDLTIDAGDWDSETASVPAVIDAGKEQLFVGDTLLLRIVDPGVAATGLIATAIVEEF